jgi:preprotein translocase subunit SecB
MAEQHAQGNGDADAGTERRFSLEKIYIKDLSFEVPNAPSIYADEQTESNIDMNLKNSHQIVKDDLYEIALTISLHAKDGDRTIFMLEIEQAGQFLIRGFSEPELRQLVSTTCPSTLFPYAREAISATIGRGGFPAILLQPINFDALFANASASTDPSLPLADADTLN